MAARQSARLERALDEVDRVNAQDPTAAPHSESGLPAGLSYGRRMSDWVARLHPDASEALRIAARAQHIRRWEIPRETYPEGRDGYLSWRAHLKRHHARVAAELLESLDYDAATVKRVQDLLRKRGIKTDPETQTLEDAACLVFLENGLADFAKTHDTDKVVSILRKVWRKMSPAGRDAALALDLPPEARRLVDDAVGAGTSGSGTG